VALALEISGVQATEITQNSALITWETDEPADSFISSGKNVEQLIKKGDADLVTDHSILMSNLDPDTKYFYAVESGGKTADNNGNGYSFQTLPPDTTAPTIEVEFPTAVQGSSLDISGLTELHAQVKIQVNGETKGTTTATSTEDSDKGQFSFTNIPLSENKENKINLIATDKADNTATKEGTVFSDTSKPKIILDELPALVQTKSITLKATISENSKYEIEVNNKAAQSGEGAVINTNIGLQQGLNEITITATDAAGWTSTEETTINSDSKPLSLNFKIEKGEQYYEGREESSINGETKPGATVYLYVYKPRGYEFKPDFTRARAKVTADAEGKFTFKDVKFASTFYDQLKQLSPKQVPSQLEQLSIFPIKDLINQQQFTYHIYLIAEDSAGRTAFKQKNIQVHTCFSGELDFSVSSMPEFQGPLRLNPQMLDEGRQEIQAVFDLQYLGSGIASTLNDNIIDPAYRIQSFDIDRACTPEMLKGESTELGCKLINKPKGRALPSADGSKHYVSWKLNRAGDFSKKEDNFWDDFSKRQLVFPIKIRVQYSERQNDGNYVGPKFQTLCYDLGYFVDIPVESKEYIPDWLAEDTLYAVNETLNVIAEIKPVMEEIYFWTGITAMASFVLKFFTRAARITSSNLEYYFTFAKKQDESGFEEDKACPTVLEQHHLYLDSTLENWQELAKTRPRKDLRLPTEVTAWLYDNTKSKDSISMDKRCPTTSALWKSESYLDQAMKWTWDRAFCRAVPAGWTDTETRETINKVILEQTQCALTGRGVPLVKREDCNELLEPAQYAHRPAYLKKHTNHCWMTQDGTLYVRDLKDREVQKEVYRLVPVGSQFEDVVPSSEPLLVYRPKGSEGYMVARDKTCTQICNSKPGYTSVECREEVSTSGTSQIQLEKGEYQAGFGQGCFVTEKPDGSAQFSQCVCKGTKPEDTGPYEKLTAVRKIGNEKEEWSYRMATVFSESAHTAGRYYPKERYYTGRDFSGAFGQNTISDYLSPKNKDAKIDPHTGFVQSLQSVCLAGIIKEITMFESILQGFSKCIQEAKYTGFHDAGMCKTLLTQHVCGLIYKSIAAATSSCSPNNFDDAGKNEFFDDSRVVTKAVSDGIGEALSSSIKDAKEEYGNAALNQYFKTGTEGLAQSMCLAAFGYDVPIFSREFLLDAAHSFPMETSAVVAPAIRELSTYNPNTKTAVYNYEVGGAIFPGCKIRNWKLSLKCIGPEDQARSGVDSTCNGKTCDCLNANSIPDASARTKVLKSGNNLANGRMFDIPLESPIKVDGHYRYDHVMLELILDPSEKGNEDKCFDDEFRDGNKATYYYPITDVSPSGGFLCKADVNTGRYFCPELIDFFDLGGAYMESPFISCYNKQTGQYTPNCKQPNLFTVNDELKTQIHLFSDGKGQCLKRTLRQNVVGISKIEVLTIPKGPAGPIVRPDFLGVVSESMLGGSGSHDLISLPSTSALCAAPSILKPSSAQNVNQEYRFKFSPQTDGSIKLVLTRGIVDGSKYDVDALSREVFRISNKAKSFSKDEINEMVFDLDGFKVSKIFQEHAKVTVNGECAFEQIKSIATPQTSRDITVTYELLQRDEAGTCFQASIPVNSKKRSHTVTIKLQKKDPSFDTITGIHAKFMAGKYSSVHLAVNFILQQQNTDLFNALAIYYDVASYVMEGQGKDKFLIQINNKLDLFFSTDYSLIQNSGEFNKIKAYLCEVDKVTGGTYQSKCKDIIPNTVNILAPAPTAPVPAPTSPVPTGPVPTAPVPTAPVPAPTPPVVSHDLCFPVTSDSFKENRQNFGQGRASGSRCHAGVDLFTKTPGKIVAVADGVVRNIYGFLDCSGIGPSWGGAGKSSALLIYHPSLGKTINYGEIDTDKVKVKKGDSITKGQELGIASYCGMLHFELYTGDQSSNIRWKPPAGKTVGSGKNYCVDNYLSTKDAKIIDGRPFIDSITGNFCDQSSNPSTPGTQVTLTLKKYQSAANGNRQVGLLTPDTFNAAVSTKVYIYFGGLGSSIGGIHGSQKTNFESLTRGSNSIIVVPQIASSNQNNWFKTGYIQLINEIKQQTGITNIASVKLIGHSMGGAAIKNVMTQSPVPKPTHALLLDACSFNWCTQIATTGIQMVIHQNENGYPSNGQNKAQLTSVLASKTNVELNFETDGHNRIPILYLGLCSLEPQICI
tara:strand:- start:77091 stop:83588 length:6498 start_codon:yes stop_codon:yes gene_type:complete